MATAILVKTAQKYCFYRLHFVSQKLFGGRFFGFGRIWRASNIEVNNSRISLQSSTELPDGIYAVYLLLEDGGYLKSEQLVKESE